VLRHFLENLATLFLIRDFAGGRGEVGTGAAFDVEREVRILFFAELAGREKGNSSGAAGGSSSLPRGI